MVLELMGGCTLHERVRNQGRLLSENIGCKIATDILQALRYLHSMQIVHRDIKPANLMFASEDPESSSRVSCARVHARVRARRCTLNLNATRTGLEHTWLKQARSPGAMHHQVRTLNVLAQTLTHMPNATAACIIRCGRTLPGEAVAPWAAAGSSAAFGGC